MKYYTYTYFHPLTGIPVYVGKGTGKRFLAHFGGNNRLGRWLRKRQREGISPYPEVNWNLLEEQAFAKEKELIKKYGREDIGTGSLFNLSDGGEGNAGYIFTAEQKARISEINRVSWQNPERRKSFSAKMKGRKLSPEHVAKIAKSNTGKSLSQEHKRKVSMSQKGKQLTEEHKAKQSAALKGRTRTPDEKASIKAALNTPEYKANVRAARQKTFESGVLRPKLTPEEKSAYKTAIQAGKMKTNRARSWCGTSEHFKLNYHKLIMYVNGQNLQDLD